MLSLNKEEYLFRGAWRKMIKRTEKISVAGGKAKEFGDAMSLYIHSFHIIYADTGGNIGYWHCGLNPERAEGFDPRLPLPGTGEAEWTGRYLPNAHEMNPDKGFVSGWNNKASPTP